MISADRTKSVRTAPLIFSFSISSVDFEAGFSVPSEGLSAGSPPSSAVVSGGFSSGGWRNLWASFSHPSKQRNAPPSISNGVTIRGASPLIASADGTRISLFTAEPLATAQTTGSSRSALTPVTCSALSARSSPSTPAVFLVATLVIAATSSRIVVMSSRRARRLVPAKERLLSREFDPILQRILRKHLGQGGNFCSPRGTCSEP